MSQLISVVAEVLDVAHWTARVAGLERALDETGLTPAVYRANLTGILMARHFPGLIQPGDCLAVAAVPLD